VIDALHGILELRFGERALSEPASDSEPLHYRFAAPSRDPESVDCAINGICAGLICSSALLESDYLMGNTSCFPGAHN
jgi:hypothetical protein